VVTTDDTFAARSDALWSGKITMPERAQVLDRISGSKAVKVVRDGLPARAAQLVPACVVLGVGVALLLRAALGSDGYSTLVNGLSLATGLPFVAVNCLVGVALVAMAWARGTRPGLGTVVQPVVTGFTISAVMGLIAEPQHVLARVAMLALSFTLLALGVAGYLGSRTGAGPAEAAALAWDPPVPFRWSYSVVQGGGAVVGWLLGADIGPGTVVVIFGLGPVVDVILTRVSVLRRDSSPTSRGAVS
jgi:uncharacterized membrane protein YczE